MAVLLLLATSLAGAGLFTHKNNKKAIEVDNPNHQLKTTYCYRSSQQTPMLLQPNQELNSSVVSKDGYFRDDDNNKTNRKKNSSAASTDSDDDQSAPPSSPRSPDNSNNNTKAGRSMKRPRTVTFDDDANAQVHPADPTPLSDEELRACFYSPDEILEINRHSAYVVGLYRKSQQGELPWFHNVYCIRGLLESSDEVRKLHSQTLLQEQERLKKRQQQQKRSENGGDSKDDNGDDDTDMDALLAELSCKCSCGTAKRARQLGKEDEAAAGAVSTADNKNNNKRKMMKKLSNVKTTTNFMANLLSRGGGKQQQQQTKKDADEKQSTSTVLGRFALANGNRRRGPQQLQQQTSVAE